MAFQVSSPAIALRLKAKSPVLFFAGMALYTMLMALAFLRGNSIVVNTVILLPFIGLAGYFLVFRQSIFALSILLVLPFSINLRDAGLGFGISLPAEPMIVLLALTFLMGLAFYGNYPVAVLRHPFSILLGLHLCWNFVTAVTSSMPLVSFKFVAIRTLYILVFYFYFILLFQQAKNRRGFFQLYLISLAAVIVYSIVRLYNTASFGEYYFTCEPFFADHTIYSACISLLLPLGLFAVLYPSAFGLKGGAKMMAVLVLFILVAGLVFSYSRAAWLSVSLTTGFYILLRLKLRFSWFAGMLIIACTAFYFYHDNFTDSISQTKEVSQQSLLKHAASMTNVKTDVSNTERINRWKCAYRMFLARPVFGFGPGTYQFQYNPFQKVSEMTYISTRHGDKGESHSEYLKPLSESGLLGFLSQLSIVLASIFYGMKVIYKGKDKNSRLLATAILLGLMTFFIHGFMNFFLDTDKFSALYWGMLAMLVLLDIQGRTEKIHAG